MPVTKVGSLLIKEAARWMDFIARLSPKSIARLENAGLIKPLETYIAGINEGTENMARLYNYQIKHRGGGSLAGNKVPDSRMNPNKMSIETDFESGPLANTHEELLRAILTRHEAYEMLAAERSLHRLGANPQKYIPRILRNFESVNPDKIGKYDPTNLLRKMSPAGKALYNASHTGFLIRNGEEKILPKVFTGHLDMDVLFKERKLLDRLPFPRNPVLEKIRQIRYRTGEYPYLDITGNYGDPTCNINNLERFNKRNARSVLKYGKGPVLVNSAHAKTLKPLF